MTVPKYPSVIISLAGESGAVIYLGGADPCRRGIRARRAPLHRLSQTIAAHHPYRRIGEKIGENRQNLVKT
jgi:hypothetical protein